MADETALMRLNGLFIVVLPSVGLDLAAVAAVIHVPGNQPTIQAGIDAAVDGDEVVVAPGRYREALRIAGKGVHLRGVGGAEQTILDGAGLSGPILLCEPQWYHTVSIDGFTFMNASATPTPSIWFTGAIALIGSPTISNCVFLENGGGAISAGGGTGQDLRVMHCAFIDNGSRAVAVGANNAAFFDCQFKDNRRGAVQTWECSPTFTDCVFEHNTSDGEGGAVYASGALGESRLTFERCTFAGNVAAGAWDLADGGAIAAAHYANVNLILIECAFDGNVGDEGGAVYNLGLQGRAQGCRFTNNDAWGGGAIGALRGASRVEWCTFDGNSASEGGAILANWLTGEPTISHCIFRQNQAVAGGAVCINPGSAAILNCVFDANAGEVSGGAIWHGGARLQVVSCTFARNQLDPASLQPVGGAICLWNVGDGATLDISNSILWGNLPDQVGIVGRGRADVDFSLIEGGWPNGIGNLSINPLFVDEHSGDFHLTANSPCIDAGDDAAVLKLLLDLDARTRIQDGNGDGRAIVDIGAYEARSP